MKEGARLVVLTGATRGLGRAMTEKFVELGHQVLGCGRNSEAVAELNSGLGEPHRFWAVDVTGDDAVKAWAEECLRVGVPDLLINNAALVNRPAPAWQVPVEEFSRVIDVNIKGVMNVMRHFAAAMVEARRGVIVNFSSGWGRSTDADVAPYCASKWAIEGLSQAMAQEVPSGMAVVPLNPGVIHTDMLQICFGDSAGGFPSPKEWAARAVPYMLKIGAKDNGRQLSVGG